MRYRVRSIFAKLGVRGRLDAVRLARARGILAAEEEPETDSLHAATYDAKGSSRPATAQ